MNIIWLRTKAPLHGMVDIVRRSNFRAACHMLRTGTWYGKLRTGSTRYVESLRGLYIASIAVRFDRSAARAVLFMMTSSIEDYSLFYSSF